MRAFLLLAVLLLAGCATTSDAPPVTPQMMSTARARHLNAEQLTIGRTAFVSRCIECHSLPRISEHSAAEWPEIVRRMSARADLSPEQRDAVTAYILAAHGG